MGDPLPDETIEIDDAELDEEVAREVNRILEKAAPERALERGKSLAHHLLDDRYLYKTTRLSVREVNLTDYALLVASRYRGMGWLNQVVRNKLRLRVSTSAPGGKGREEIVKLGSPVVVQSPRSPRRSLAPFRRPEG